MRGRVGRREMHNSPVAVFHVVLRGCRPGPLVESEGDWRKMIEGIESMLFWCGGRVLGCRCEGDRLELAIEPARVSLGRMLRYVTVPFALHVNRASGQSGKVFRPLRVYRLQAAFRTEFVLWLHRPLAGSGWSADGAYREPDSMPWVDPVPVLEELGRGPGAKRQYRVLRARGVDAELALAFASSRDTLAHIHSAVRPAVAEPKRRQRELLRCVVAYVSRRESVAAVELAGRSRVRALCRARCLVTLVAVRCGVSLSMIAMSLGRDGSTLEESVLRMRARDPDGLLVAVDAILAALDLGACRPATESGEEPVVSAENGAESGPVAPREAEDPDSPQGRE